MKKFSIIALLSISITSVGFSQAMTWVTSGACTPNSPSLQTILLNSCGVEAYHEFFIFNTGNVPFDPTTITTSSSNGAPPPAIPASASNYRGV
ncbi:MAG: hypothetical protein ACOYOA_14010, partial [Saprospiraceae bacterium]